MKQICRRQGTRLIQGEALETLQTLARRGETFDAVVTDPPYSSGGLHLTTKTRPTAEKYSQHSSRKTNATRFGSFGGDSRSQLGWLAWSATWLNVCRAMLPEGAPVLTFCDWRQITAAVTAMEAGGFTHRGVVVWDKKSGRPAPNGFSSQCEFIVWGTNGRRQLPDDLKTATYCRGVLQHATPPVKKRRHHTMKPVALMADLLAVVPEGGHVIDPFAGSGSTLKAARSLNLKATGIEENPEIARKAADWLKADG
jgi:site-specific DNA-methyltransferase (adenine-specific)